MYCGGVKAQFQIQEEMSGRQYYIFGEWWVRKNKQAFSLALSSDSKEGSVYKAFESAGW